MLLLQVTFSCLKKSYAFQFFSWLDTTLNDASSMAEVLIVWVVPPFTFIYTFRYSSGMVSRISSSEGNSEFLERTNGF